MSGLLRTVMRMRAARFIQRLGGRIARDDLGAYAAALSYNFSFALLPLMLFATALLAFLHDPDPVATLTGPLGPIVPQDVLSLVTAALEGVVRHRSPTVLSLGFLGFVWGMSGAFRQIIDGVNHAYEFRFPLRRKGWQMYGVSVLLGMTVGTLLVGGMALSVLGPDVVRGLAAAVLGHAPARVVQYLLHWGALAAMLWVALSILYAVAPDQPRPFRLYTPGTLVVEAGWGLLSLGFRLYTTRVNTFGVYGTLGTLILLLLYLYLFGFVLLIGAEINALAEPPPPPDQREEGGIPRLPPAPTR
jgi:membrane protein